MTEPPPVQWIAIPDWDEVPPPAQEWTVKERIPRRQVTLFTGEGGTGKSTIGLHLCCAHVLGRDCLTELPEFGPAFFIDAEDELSVVGRRLDFIRRHYDASFAELDAGGLHILSLAGKDALLAVDKRGLVTPTPLFDGLIAQASEIKPQTIVIASSANVFAGDEINRSQVTQFVNLLTRLAIAANGSVILIAHPSQTGIANDTGISGSTSWHNAVRARMFLKSAKANGAEPADPGLKLLEWRKNQYGPPAAAVALRWRDGMFLVDGGPSIFDKAVAEAKGAHVFEDLLRRFNRDGAAVSSNPFARNYAPKAFADEPEAKIAKLSKLDLNAAMRLLFDHGKLKNLTYGKASKAWTRIDFT